MDGGRAAVKVEAPDATYVVLTQPDSERKLIGWGVTANTATCAVARVNNQGQKLIRWAMIGTGELATDGMTLAGESADEFRAGERLV